MSKRFLISGTRAVAGVLLLAATANLYAADAADRALSFPDAADGRKVLAYDLHMHTAFSDGQVMPAIRVAEAVRDGLSGMAVTEHLEYHIHADSFALQDRNQSYRLASKHTPKQLVVINGAELTRNYPPGHVNAVFLNDVNALLLPGVQMTSDRDRLMSSAFAGDDVARRLIDAARKQGAFVTWNHPNWLEQQPAGRPVVTELHRKLIAEGGIAGIELNGSEENFQIALDYNLALLANSDVHGTIETQNQAFDAQYDVTDPLGSRRRATLILAAENNLASVRSAMFDRATVALEKNALFGRQRELAQIVAGSLSMEPAGRAKQSGRETQTYRVRLHNTAPIPFLLRNVGRHTFIYEQNIFEVAARSTRSILITAITDPAELTDLRFEVLNAYTAPRRNLTIHIDPLGRIRVADDSKDARELCIAHRR